MSLRKFGLFFIAGVVILIASGLIYWLLTKDSGVAVAKASLVKVDKSSNLLKASVEQTNVFQSDYLGELITAGCLITAVILYKITKYKCKTMVAPQVTSDPPPHAPHAPAPVQTYPPPAPAPVHTYPPVYLQAPPPSYAAAAFADQAQASTSTSTVRYKKSAPVEHSDTETSTDSETDTPLEVVAAAKKRRKRKRNKKGNPADVVATPAPLENAT